MDFVNEWFKNNEKRISHGTSVSYQASVRSVSESEDEEIKLARNLFGPHRDEVIFTFDDRPARRFSSRGQARLIALSLKAAESYFMAQELGIKPIVLLDDLFSELDEKNSQVVLELFEPSSQIILTKIDEGNLANYVNLIVKH